MTRRRLAYGPDPSQFADLYLPAQGGRTGVAVVVHGGYWRDTYGCELTAPIAADLARHGVAAWNVEYRRLGNGGGWPHTFADVAAAVDFLADLPPDLALHIDARQVVAVGHSAGGQLAAWLGARHRLPAGAPGARPRVALRGILSQAGVLDLELADRLGLSTGATAALMDGHADQRPEEYSQASPTRLLPTGVESVLVHPVDDPFVPVELSRRYHHSAVAAGDACTLIETDGDDHFSVVTVDHPAWGICRDHALRMLG